MGFASDPFALVYSSLGEATLENAKMRTSLFFQNLYFMSFASAGLTLAFVLAFLDYVLGMFESFDIPDMDELVSPGVFWIGFLLTFTIDFLLTISTFRNQPAWTRCVQIVIGCLFCLLGTWLVIMASRDRGELELGVIPVLFVGVGLLVVGINRLLFGAIGLAMAVRWVGSKR